MASKHRQRPEPNSLRGRFLLLLAGAAAGVTGGLLVRDAIPLTQTAIAAAIFLGCAAIGFSIPTSIADKLSTWWRRLRRNAIARVGILADLGADAIDNANSAGALLAPRKWLELARDRRARSPRIVAKLISSNA